MSKDQINTFNEAVWVLATKHGKRPAYISGDIIDELFPRTMLEASNEGAMAYLRDGVNKAVKKVLSMKPSDDAQSDMGDIDASFAPYVTDLKRWSYYVESEDEFFTVPDLIKNVEMLDEARRYLRQKGEETLAEAAKLDKLYQAVVAANDNSVIAAIAA